MAQGWLAVHPEPHSSRVRPGLAAQLWVQWPREAPASSSTLGRPLAPAPPLPAPRDRPARPLSTWNLRLHESKTRGGLSPTPIPSWKPGPWPRLLPLPPPHHRQARPSSSGGCPGAALPLLPTLLPIQASPAQRTLHCQTSRPPGQPVGPTAPSSTATFPPGPSDPLPSHGSRHPCIKSCPLAGALCPPPSLPPFLWASLLCCLCPHAFTASLFSQGTRGQALHGWGVSTQLSGLGPAFPAVFPPPYPLITGLKASGCQGQ